MVANLMHVAGVTHVITIDLHASQMQGFFKCPVDNLVAEPLLAKWIRNNVGDWRNAVCVSKNPGGTKRVTSLADALKLSFGIITTDRRRQPYMHDGHMPGSMLNSLMLDGIDSKSGHISKAEEDVEDQLDIGEAADAPIEHDYAPQSGHIKPSEYLDTAPDGFPRRPAKPRATTSLMPGAVNRLANSAHIPPSPLAQSIRPESSDGDSRRPSMDPEVQEPPTLTRMKTVPGTTNEISEAEDNGEDEEFVDEVRTSLKHGKRQTD